MTKFFTREGREFELDIRDPGTVTYEHDGRVYDREPHHRLGRFGVCFVERAAPRGWLLEYRIKEATDAKGIAHEAKTTAAWQQGVE